MAAPVTYMSIEDFFGNRVDIDDLDANTLRSDHLSAQTFIPLDICALREIATNAIQNLAAHGGILASDSTPILERVNGATDKALRVKWAASDSNEAQFPPVPWPPDLDDTSDVIVHLLLSRSGTTDGCIVDVQAYENTVTGSAYAADTEMGGNTSALTGSANVIIEATRTLSASDIVGHPGFLNLSLVPAAHTTDILYLWAAWIEYQREIRTS